jgi:hypothetical protein
MRRVPTRIAFIKMALSTMRDDADAMMKANEICDNPTLYNYPGKTKSKVWDYFGFLKIKDGPVSKQTLDMSTAVCRKCHKKYINKGKATSVLFLILYAHVCLLLFLGSYYALVLFQEILQISGNT